MSGRLWRVGAAWVGSVVVAAGIGWWAAGTIGRPPPDLAPASPWANYQVEVGEVGQVQSFFAQAAWSVTALGRAPVAGTITSVDLPEDGILEPGTVVAGIDLRPIVVVAGQTPAFRDLASGARGADVAQLREHLVAGCGRRDL